MHGEVLSEGGIPDVIAIVELGHKAQAVRAQAGQADLIQGPREEALGADDVVGGEALDASVPAALEAVEVAGAHCVDVVLGLSGEPAAQEVVVLVADLAAHHTEGQLVLVGLEVGVRREPEVVRVGVAVAAEERHQGRVRIRVELADVPGDSAEGRAELRVNADGRRHEPGGLLIRRGGLRRGLFDLEGGGLPLDRAAQRGVRAAEQDHCEGEWPRSGGDEVQRHRKGAEHRGGDREARWSRW